MNWDFSVSWVSYFWMFLNIQYHLQLTVQTIYRFVLKASFSLKVVLFIYFFVSFSAFFVRQLWLRCWLLPEWCSQKPSLRLDDAMFSVIESRTQHQIKELVCKALASVHGVRYLSQRLLPQRLLHFQGWQEKKWLTRSVNVLLKKFFTVARNLGIDTNSADFVSISLGVMKILHPILFLSVQSVFLSWCTGTLTTNAKNSTLHSPVEYVPCCPSMLGMTCTTWSLALERSFCHLDSNSNCYCSLTLQLYFSLTFYTIKCLVMFYKIMTTLRKSPVVSHNDVFCLFLFDEVLIRGKIPLIICLFWKIIVALDGKLSLSIKVAS